jgi:acyl-CoA synthetase (AMP-forming)/AMP-acid ligase II
MGLVGMALGALYVARPCVLMRPHLFVKRPVDWLRAIARYRGTVSFAPNFAFDLCVRRVKDLDGLDLSSWRVAGCGAEPIHAPTLLAFAEKFAPAGFRETALLPSYGLAEHVLAATFSPLRPAAADSTGCRATHCSSAGSRRPRPMARRRSRWSAAVVHSRIMSCRSSATMVARCRNGTSARSCSADPP